MAEEEKDVTQDLEWEPVPLGLHLKFAIEKMAEEYEAATEEIIRRWRERKTG